jgi:dipeptidyl aminopeptidase/acylaminoacyl peptidase
MMHSRFALSLLLLCLVASFTLADEPQDPARPSAIRAEGVPVVPPEMIQRLQQYQSVRGASFAGWSPDRRGMLIRTRFGNSAQLHRVYGPGGRREQITFFEEPVSGYFLPAARDGAILYSLSSGGNEQNQVFLLDRVNYRSVMLTDGKSKYSLGPMREDGSQIILSSTERNGRDTDLLIANPRKPDSREMLWQTQGEFWSAADWSLDGRTVLMRRYVSANESYPALLDVATKRKTDLPLPEEGKAAIGPLALSPDARFVYVATDSGGEFRRLARFDLETGKYTWLSADIPWDVTELEVDPRTGNVAFAVNEDGASRLFLLSPAANDGEPLRRELKLPLAIVSDLEFSPDGGALGLTLARPDAPPDVYSLDLAADALTRWTFSETGGLNPANFILPERIQYMAFDGRQIPAYYYRPRGASKEKPVGVVIMIHGGPESQFQPYFSPVIQYYLNEMNLAVIAPNVRGSSGYGKTYLALDNGTKREYSVRDIGALLDWIETRQELDASRVAVSGGSYGGYMVLASLVHFGDRIKAGIDNVGIANFITFLESTAAYRQDLRRVEYGDERDPMMREHLIKISPANHADKIRSALLVLHGKNDPRVPVGEATQIAERVRKQGKEVWTVIADNEGHGFAKRDNASYARAVEALFLQEQLGGRGLGTGD